jgi:hypothetical protein
VRVPFTDNNNGLTFASLLLSQAAVLAIGLLVFFADMPAQYLPIDFDLVGQNSFDLSVADRLP